MPCLRVRVRRSVTVRRTVAAAHMPAAQTLAQMQPCAADAQAVLAALCRARSHFPCTIQMGALPTCEPALDIGGDLPCRCIAHAVQRIQDDWWVPEFGDMFTPQSRTMRPCSQSCSFIGRARCSERKRWRRLLPFYFRQTTRPDRLLQASTGSHRLQCLQLTGSIANHRETIGSIDLETLGSRLKCSRALVQEDPANGSPQAWQPSPLLHL